MHTLAARSGPAAQAQRQPCRLDRAAGVRGDRQHEAQLRLLSYAGTLTITVVADPDTVPDLSDLGALRAGLATLGRTVEAVS